PRRPREARYAGAATARRRAAAAGEALVRADRNAHQHWRDAACRNVARAPALCRRQSGDEGGAQARRQAPARARLRGDSMERQHEKYERLIEFCRKLPPTSTAVAHPCDESSLKGAVDAAKLGLISPILVGPRQRIEAVAKQFRIDISGFPIVDAAHSHDAADK